jgi:hypothetical protein
MSLSQKVSFDTTLGLFWLCIRSLLTLTRTSVWMAGLYYERHVDVTAAALGIPETEELDGAGGGGKEVTGLLTLSVRGSKQGAVCTGPIPVSVLT